MEAPPGLNRGWRFCRPFRVVNRDAWLHLLVPDAVWLFPAVWALFRSAPKFRPARLRPLSSGRLAGTTAKATVGSRARRLALAGPATNQRCGRDKAHLGACVSTGRRRDPSDLDFRSGFLLGVGIEIRAKCAHDRVGGLFRASGPARRQGAPPRTHSRRRSPRARARSDSASPSFHPSIPEDATSEPAGIGSMDRDPDFLSGSVCVRTPSDRTSQEPGDRLADARDSLRGLVSGYARRERRDRVRRTRAGSVARAAVDVAARRAAQPVALRSGALAAVGWIPVAEQPDRFGGIQGEHPVGGQWGHILPASMSVNGCDRGAERPTLEVANRASENGLGGAYRAGSLPARDRRQRATAGPANARCDANVSRSRSSRTAPRRRSG